MSQQSKSTLQAAINTQLADNTSGDISAADVRDNLINMTDSLLFNNETTQTLTGALTVSAGITGSLQGIATTASYVETAQTASYVLNAVSASYAATASVLLGSVTSASYAATASTATFANTSNNILHGNITSNDDYSITFTNIAGYSSVFCRIDPFTGASPFTYNPSTSLLKITGSIIATGGITGSLQGTAATASYVENAQTASYVVTAQTASYFNGTVTTAATASYVENAQTASYVAGTNVDGYVNAAVNADYADLIYFNSTFILSEDFPIVFGTTAFNSYGGVQNDLQNLLYNPFTNRLTLSGSQVVTGSITATSGFIGSLQGTASYATTAATASYVPVTETAANVNLPLTLTDGNSLLKDQYNSITYNPANNVLNVVAYTNFTGSITSQNGISSTGGFTGSLQGTASYATQALSASYAATASYVNPLIQDVQLTGSLNVSSSIILNGILNHGLGTVATGDYSQASGYYSEAVGPYSRAHGQSVIANSDYSCAEGQFTFADGFGSHAEGESTRTSGNFSHAEGFYATASGNYSHAEGSGSRASGISSHAEGQNTIASGSYSHAEGQNTIALGSYSHAEGFGTQAIGVSSHAEGQNTIAFGSNSHAEGTGQALGDWSHAEGTNTISLGYSSHAEGEGTVASGSSQHVQGKWNTHGDDTSLMIVGNGTSTFARKDAFKVRMSGSIVLPTTQSATPSWTGTDGEIVPATVGGEYFLYMWMNGAWRSGSFV